MSKQNSNKYQYSKNNYMNMYPSDNNNYENESPKKTIQTITISKIIKI